MKEPRGSDYVSGIELYEVAKMNKEKITTIAKTCELCGQNTSGEEQIAYFVSTGRFEIQ